MTTAYSITFLGPIRDILEEWLEEDEWSEGEEERFGDGEGVAPRGPTPGEVSRFSGLIEDRIRRVLADSIDDDTCIEVRDCDDSNVETARNILNLAWPGASYNRHWAVTLSDLDDDDEPRWKWLSRLLRNTFVD